MAQEKKNENLAAGFTDSSGTMSPSDGDMSASQIVEETIKKRLAVLEEAYAFSEEEDEVEDDDDDDTEAQKDHSRSTVGTMSTALTVIAFPRHLLASKWAVAAILVTSTCLLGYYTYSYTNDEQTKEFVEQVSGKDDDKVCSMINLAS